MTRRTPALVAAFALAAVALTACSTGPTGGTGESATSPSTSAVADQSAFPVTIDHHFGETTIEKAPQRVVAIGSSDPDNVLALGVVPVGIGKVTWGGNEHGTTPWFDAKLDQMGGQQPTLLDQTDAIPFDDIAKLTPDVILATYSGLTKAQYDKLSKIAPVVAYPQDPWQTTWQDSLEMDAEALGRTEQAEQLEQATTQELDAVKQQYPELVGKTFIWAALATTDLSQVPYYTPGDARPTFLASLGMKNAPIIEKIAPQGEFYGQVSAERAAELKSDVLVTYAVKDSDAATYRSDKLIGQIPAIKSGHMFAATDNTASLAAGVPTPLSVPYAVAHFVPNLVKAVDGQ
jgi:iron complex transport system substrate-binding protein